MRRLALRLVRGVEHGVDALGRWLTGLPPAASDKEEQGQEEK